LQKHLKQNYLNPQNSQSDTLNKGIFILTLATVRARAWAYPPRHATRHCDAQGHLHTHVGDCVSSGVGISATTRDAAMRCAGAPSHARWRLCELGCGHIRHDTRRGNAMRRGTFTRTLATVRARAWAYPPRRATRHCDAQGHLHTHVGDGVGSGVGISATTRDAALRCAGAPSHARWRLRGLGLGLSNLCVLWTFRLNYAVTDRTSSERVCDFVCSDHEHVCGEKVVRVLFTMMRKPAISCMRACAADFYVTINIFFYFRGKPLSTKTPRRAYVDPKMQKGSVCHASTHRRRQLQESRQGVVDLPSKWLG
jgi:hypothetical protein